MLQQYVSLINKFSDESLVPGSPALAAALMRETDEMHGIELHPQAWQALRSFAKTFPAEIHCHKRDAYEGLAALVPPKNKRGAILIDPPYEDIHEYKDVVKTTATVLKKWPNAQILIWIPLLGQRAKQKAAAAETMVSEISALTQEQVTVSLQIEDKEAAQGMYGSLIVAINPFWKFAETLSQSLAIVAPQLGQHCTWSVR